MLSAFICGCGHSGTSLLANMFAAHPRVHIPLRETAMFFRRSPGMRLKYFQALTLLRGKRLFVEKTPRHVERVEMIRKVAPQSKIILIVRDGRDVAASIYKRTGNLDAALDRWIAAAEQVREFEHRPGFTRVRYEDLIVRPEEELKRLCSFADLDYSPSMLRYHEKARMWFGTKQLRKGTGQDGQEHNDLRNWQINQPIFDGRGSWTSVLPDGAPARLTIGEGARLMRAFGYLP
ncbi:MAG: sulfotransferase [Novosphingobium sp.]|nr:sulfotransferase [Novosphingobium sp.]